MVVYMHTTPSGKKYIGITQQSVKQRWRNGEGYKRNTYFYRAIQKYGWENIKHEILADGLTEEEANSMEERLVREYDLTNPERGYNLHTGGLHHKVSEETKRKFSQSFKGRLAGEKNPFYEKHHPPEIMELIYKKVEQYGLDGEYIKTYNSMKDAVVENNVDASELTKACKGIRRTCGGFQWKYQNDDKVIEPYRRSTHNKKRVAMCDMEGNVLKVYQSLTEAGKQFAKNGDKSIGDCCRGKQSTAYGYIWKYE